MGVPPESIEVGKCYLSNDGRVRRVAKFLPSGRIRYVYRSFPAARQVMADRTLGFGAFRGDHFARGPCNWMLSSDK